MYVFYRNWLHTGVKDYWIVECSHSLPFKSNRRTKIYLDMVMHNYNPNMQKTEACYVFVANLDYIVNTGQSELLPKPKKQNLMIWDFLFFFFFLNIVYRMSLILFRWLQNLEKLLLLHSTLLIFDSMYINFVVHFSCVVNFGKKYPSLSF